MNKSIWLLRLLSSHPDGLTKADILDAWADEDDRHRPMAVSTFYDNRHYLESRFNLRIVCRAGRYTLDTNADDDAQLLRRIVGEDAATAADAAAPGDEWIPVIAEAMDRSQSLRTDYAPLDKPPYEMLLAPYFLRRIGGRSYVVGRSDRHADVRIFATDRIRYTTPTAARFRRPAGLTAEQWFASGFGAFAGPGLSAVHVVIEPLTRRLAEHLRRRPIHPSQREEDGAARFHLDVALTPNFIGSLLAMGPDVRIVAPADLRRLVRDKAAAILRNCE